MPIQLPIVDSKARAFWFVFIYFFAFEAMMYINVHEDPDVAAVREYFDKSGRLLWPIYLMAVGGFWIVYGLLFSIKGRRQLYSFYSFGLSGFLVIALFHSFWWCGYVALAVMLAVLLIAQLYPAPNTDSRSLNQ